MAEQTCPLHVVAPANGVTKFSLYHGAPAISLILGGDAESGQIRLAPEVFSEGRDYPIYLTDASQVKLEVGQPEDPVVAIDSDGLIRGLRPGKASVTGTFGGIQERILVYVYSANNAPAGYGKGTHQ
jgi:hypothetical protein